MRNGRVMLTLALLLVVSALYGPRWLLGPEVASHTVEPRTLVQTVAATGRVRAPARIELAAAQLGLVARASCSEGQRVEERAVLFQLAPEEQAAALAQAQAQLVQAEVRLEEIGGLGRKLELEALRRAEIGLLEAEDRLARLERVAQAVPESQLADARRARALADSQLTTARAAALGSEAQGPRLRLQRAEVERARAAVAAARARLEQTQVRAPAPGIIAACRASAGEVVGAGRALAVLVLDGPPEIVIEPDEKNVARLLPGQMATVQADAFPERPFVARVERVVPAVDPLRGTVEVRLRPEGQVDYLVADMTVSVEIEAARRARALVVPREAVVEPGAPTPSLWVLEAGRAARRLVRLGLPGDGVVEVLEGVRAGDQLLLPRGQPLTAGARVRPREEPR